MTNGLARVVAAAAWACAVIAFGASLALTAGLGDEGLFFTAVIAQAVLVVMLIVWHVRAVRRASVLVAWLVPVLNWLAPAELLKRWARAVQVPIHPRIHAWWGCWVLSVPIILFGGLLFGGTEDAMQRGVSYGLGILAIGNAFLPGIVTYLSLGQARPSV